MNDKLAHHLPRSNTMIMTDRPAHRSCMELGFCQSRKPACNGCTVSCFPEPRSINFAPGVIQRLPRLSRKSSRRIERIAGWLAIWVIVTMAVGYWIHKLGLL
jgi:hypothetical protein